MRSPARASGPVTGWRSCSATGRRWRRPSSARPRTPRRRRSTPPTVWTSSPSTSKTCGAKALILEAGAKSPAIEAAARVGVPIIGLTPEPGAGAGCFTLDIPSGTAARGNGDDADDAALVLHTSGTTSRPKIVPLTGANLCASARNIADWISLSPGDRCLNIMPLFHIHGLMAGVMASLHAGACVICTPWLQRAPRLRVARRDGAHLAHRRAHHAPGDPRARPAQQGDHRAPPAPSCCARPPPRCRRR